MVRLLLFCFSSHKKNLQAMILNESPPGDKNHRLGPLIFLRGPGRESLIDHPQG
jgi:hypothetical protein